MADTTEYGEFYWCVFIKVTENGPNERIYLMADEVDIHEGALVFSRAAKVHRSRFATAVFAPGRWVAFFAASLVDGAFVAVKEWSSGRGRE